MKTCFFIGHREADERLFPHIKTAAENLINKEGVTDFYVGSYGNFDRMAGEAVIHLKTEYPTIRLFLLLPYHPGEKRAETPDGYDGTYYPEGMEYVPRRYAISKANHLMIDKADYLIAFVWHTASNANNLLEYARRREKKGLLHIINLGDRTTNDKY